MHAKSIRPETIAYSYEYMVQSKGTQTAVFSAVCADWGIEFKPEMLEFKDNFGAKFIYRDAKEEAIYTKINPKDIFKTVAESKEVLNKVPEHGLITQEQKQRLIDEIMPIYLEMHEATVKAFAPEKPAVVKPLTRKNDR
tara:strand:- start:197 stop:613 length:417 start_codon:yes stop_codon:yes gene_type:complete